MIIIIATKNSADEIAEALGDQRRSGQLAWVSSSVDIRAIRQAIALSGGWAIAISEFWLGVATGAVLSLLFVALFQQAVSLGEALSRLHDGPSITGPFDEE